MNKKKQKNFVSLGLGRTGLRPRRLMGLRAASPQEAIALSALCLRAKAVWGYDEAFMRACRDELTLTPAEILASQVQVAADQDRILGMVQLVLTGNVALLDKLYVDPTILRAGLGRVLFEWARTFAHEAGAAVMTIDADPNAAGFYRRMGAIDDGEVPSGSIPGRMLPRLRVNLY